MPSGWLLLGQYTLLGPDTLLGFTPEGGLSHGLWPSQELWPSENLWPSRGRAVRRPGIDVPTFLTIDPHGGTLDLERHDTEPNIDPHHGDLYLDD